jgi:predicted dehydrogenase
VWVDKPLAASVADAEEIIATATRSSAALTSSSALRWVPSTDEYARRLADIGELHAITVTGPADEFDPHSGLIFYGIHIADVAQRLLPGSPEVVDVEHLGGMIVAQYRLGNVRVSLEFVQPDDDGQVPFRVTAVGRHGVISGEIEIDEHYVEPGVDAFATMLATGSQPISMDEMLAPVRILEQVRQSIGR